MPSNYKQVSSSMYMDIKKEVYFIKWQKQVAEIYIQFESTSIKLGNMENNICCFGKQTYIVKMHMIYEHQIAGNGYLWRERKGTHL